jgi:hypothetical protein
MQQGVCEDLCVCGHEVHQGRMRFWLYGCLQDGSEVLRLGYGKVHEGLRKGLKLFQGICI